MPYDAFRDYATTYISPERRVMLMDAYDRTATADYWPPIDMEGSRRQIRHLYIMEFIADTDFTYDDIGGDEFETMLVLRFGEEAAL